MEYLLIIAACISMGRIADFEGRSSIGWGFFMFVLCLAAVEAVPIPILRIILAFIIGFIAITIAKVRSG